MSRDQVGVMLTLPSAFLLLAAAPSLLARPGSAVSAAPAAVVIAVSAFDPNALRLADFGDVEPAR